ncbi:MAG: hypothetical protein ACK4GR_06065, partial [bacterium]
MKNKKGAALIVTLFMLVIVSTFVSLIFLISKNEIKLFGKAREESKYTQYLKEAVDITISPLVMGRGDWVSTNPQIYQSKTSQRDEFCDFFNDPNNNIIQNNNVYTDNSAISLNIKRDRESQGSVSFIINISRRIEPNSNIWIVSNVRGVASYIDKNLPIPEYELFVNTIIVSNPNNINNGVDNFTDFVNTVQNSINSIIWTGRARATVQQRTPYNVAGGSALFVKYAGLWVPFGANPFYTALTGQGIDSCVGLAEGYSILGDVVTPKSDGKKEKFKDAFDIRSFDGWLSDTILNYRMRVQKSGITTVWNGTNGKIIRGGASTGYAEINPHELGKFNPANQDFSIRTNYNARVISDSRADSNVKGRIPGEALADNNVVDLDSISNRRTTIRIAPPNNRAVVVGERVDGNGNLTGQIRTRPLGGGLVEVLWPLDQNGNPVPINPN